MSTIPTRVNHTFPPIYDQNSRILILGTFPSVKSREGDFYYHHPQNRFWKVLSRVLGVDVPQTIEDKKKMLLNHHIAIWDVIATCDIVGSSDASIKNIIPNDIPMILNTSSIKYIFANGNKAYELYMKYCFPATGREIIKLPSTSPANAAFSLDKLTDVWSSTLATGIPLVIKTNEPAKLFTLTALCQDLSISVATGRNWLKSGRLVPDFFKDNTPLFSQEYIYALKETIQTSENAVLKSRRNKNYISGNQFYDSYLSSDSPNIHQVKKLLEYVEKLSYPADETGIGLVLAECALQLYTQKNYVNFKSNKQALTSGILAAYLEGDITCNTHQSLISTLIKHPAQAKKGFNQYPEIFSIKYTYVPDEDLLGLLYLSLRNMGSRKTNGAYYTPVNVVKQLLQELPPPSTTDKLLDPCCGTGNFLLQLPYNWHMEQIFANDIDEISVAVTRINLSIKFPKADTKLLCSHIQCRNFLTDNDSTHYNYIIGNPPWGFTYSEEEKKFLKKHFASAGKKPESYDLFIEKALQQLETNGTLSFVLPEAVLNVRSHKAVRQLIFDNSKLHTLTYLGNIFDGVWCPSVILQLGKTNLQFSVKGARITNPQRSFTIKKERPVTTTSFHLDVTDEEYSILHKIETLNNVKTLKRNADFALGIVTGDNKHYLFPANETNEKKPTIEPVLKGSDIDKYRIKPAKYCIDFQPEQFQQCAPIELYRSPEKLLYRFIGQKLVFAYDNKQRISLNSCNIVIPHLDGLDIKYILTILNSRIAQFFIRKKWNSLKVLRSHLEQIPIPVIPANEQAYYIHMADALMYETDNNYANSEDTDLTKTSKAHQFTDLYNELDKAIAKLYGLTEEEYMLIRHEESALASSP